MLTCRKNVSSIAPGTGHVIITGGVLVSASCVGDDKKKTTGRSASNSVTVTENLDSTDRLNSETGFYRIPASSAHIPGKPRK